MKNQENSAKQNAGRGRSRISQNRKIRRDALREELKSREYIRQIHSIADRLDPTNKKAFDGNEVQRAKARADIYFRLLDKCLPNLRPVEQAVSFQLGETLTENGVEILSRVSDGNLSPSEAFTLMQSLSAQARIIEVTELEQRLIALEKRYEATGK